MKIRNSILSVILLLFISYFTDAQDKLPFKPQALVGYYNVGVKPGKPFFRSRWYMREGQLYAIFDSDEDRPVKLFENGKLRHNVFLSEKALPEVRNDTTYYLILNFNDDQDRLQGFKVLRPRRDWPTDLYASRSIKFDHLAVDTEEILTEELVSDHFLIQYSDKDTGIVEGISSTLEEHYNELISDFGLVSLPQTIVRIYPDKDTYNNAVLTPDAPLWQMGRVWDSNEIRMLSPLMAEQLTGEKLEINEIVLHEFVHSIHLNLVKDGTRVPGWLWEGLALYKGCCRWVENPFELDHLKKGKYPSLKKIEKDRTSQLKYDLGYYLVEYIDQKWGWNKVLELIDSNGNLETTLKVSIKGFEKGFYRWMERKYQK